MAQYKALLDPGSVVVMCRKPKFGSDSVFKNRNIQKFDIRSHGFPKETSCYSQFQL